MKINFTIFSWLVEPAKYWLNQRLNAWLKRRIPQAQKQQINYRNIFIMPTRFGAAYGFFTLILFLLGTNYQNNIIILISYLLVSFFIVVLHHSFFNLSGLTFVATRPVLGYAETQLSFPLVIINKKTRFNIHFSFYQGLVNQGSTSNDFAANSSFNPKASRNESREHKSRKQKKSEQKSKVVLELAQGESEILVPFCADKRGRFTLTRMLIASEYGFGLFRTWTRLDFGQQATIFPKPLSYAWQQAQQIATGDKQNEDVESQQNGYQAGHDEFYQLQQYQYGEPFSRVAWKQVARGQGWLTKQFQQNLSGQLQLDFNSLPEATLEQKLRLLSYAINDCSQQQIAFSLKLPNQTFPYDHSPEHTLRCLTALACY
jgi:hypothetical protein